MEKPKLCVFCGKDESFGTMNVEHFVPRCLWDKERPAQTMTVPAHKKCNDRYSADNEYFRDMLAISEKCSKHPEVAKLNQGTLRRKLLKRRGYFVKNLKNVRVAPTYAETGLYVGHSPMFDWDWKRAETVLHNVMKGIFYAMNERPMPHEMQLDVGEVRDDADLVSLQKYVDAMCPWVGFGDDVFGARFVFHSADKYMYCLMQFYRSVTFFGSGLLSEKFAAEEQTCG
ncbi:MAG: hypothetical protein K8T89_02630 [Planctomycetes bacterium]|nr:hypothetical protein [Planctomycetota bacterium]